MRADHQEMPTLTELRTLPDKEHKADTRQMLQQPQGRVWDKQEHRKRQRGLEDTNRKQTESLGLKNTVSKPKKPREWFREQKGKEENTAEDSHSNYTI